MPDVLADLARIMELWAQARARFGGDGQYPVWRMVGAVDIMFAPVVTRIVTYWPARSRASPSPI